MIVTVTEKHIKEGKPYDKCECPVSLALKDLGYTPVVDVKAAYIKKGEDEFVAPLRAEARDFVARFDRGQEVFPFSFELEVD